MNSGKLDPRLRYLRDLHSSQRQAGARSIRVSASPASDGTDIGVDVLIRCRKDAVGDTNDVEKMLQDQGVQTHASIDGNDVVVTGRIPVSKIDALLALHWVEYVEAGMQLTRELDLSSVDIQLRPISTEHAFLRGHGVVVGTIDSGIDITHPDFRLPNGHTRLLAYWDQRHETAGGGSRQRVPYGREYSRDELNQALETGEHFPPPDTFGHGTHVAGIAAGNGRQSNGLYTGIAPEAEIIAVAHLEHPGRLLESTSIADGFAYIATRARELGRPVALNLSNGTNGGGHSGETVLETALDNLARRSGVVIVKSAGNEQSLRMHAVGRVAQNATITRRFESRGGNDDLDLIEIWFDSHDEISISIQPPGEALPSGERFVAPGSTRTFGTLAGNSVRIDAESVDSGGTGDTRVCIFVERGSAKRIQPGVWAIHLRGDSIDDGTVHLWMERTNRGNGGYEQSRFTPTDSDPTCLITIPGTARRVITVGCYATRPAEGSPKGAMSAFSSRGPSRYGVRKPDLCAPGESIVSARSSAMSSAAITPGYVSMGGTSMAAPHVTGAAALVLQINPSLTCEQVRQILTRAAQAKGAVSGTPDDTWGAGRLRISHALTLALQARFPVISNVTVKGATIQWQTDIPTTGAVCFDQNRRRLLLGHTLGSRVDLETSCNHKLTLTDLPPGRYFCELLSFTDPPEEWHTLDDNGGRHYAVCVS